MAFLYNGEAYVGTTGRKKLEISQPSLVKLEDAFRKADYLGLAGQVDENPAPGVTRNLQARE
jgi:hypothetical protein